MKNESQSATKHLLAGSASGLISSILFQPLDLIKTRLQQTNSPTILETLRVSGIGSFWRGSTSTILRTVPGSGLYFASQHTLRTRKFTAFQSGVLARVAVGFAMMPLTVVKTRFESSIYTDKTIVASLTAVLRTNGVKGLWAGFGATALRDAPFAGTYLYLYTESRRLLHHTLDNSPAFKSNFACGVFAGCAATLITQPFDTLKTRIALGIHPNLVVGFLAILKTSGVAGLFTGILPRLMRKPLSSAVTWSVYEEIVGL